MSALKASCLSGSTLTQCERSNQWQQENSERAFSNCRNEVCGPIAVPPVRAAGIQSSCASNNNESRWSSQWQASYRSSSSFLLPSASSSFGATTGFNLQLSRREQFASRRQVAAPRAATDASFGGEPAVFPRIHTRDPHRRLGVTRDASTEEIQEAKNFLLEEYGSHERSREAIEEAYDKIIAAAFSARKKTKINLKADLKKRVANSPMWVQNFLSAFEVPESKIIMQRLLLFVIIAAWSILNPAVEGPAFQVAVAFAAAVYLLNDRMKSIPRAFWMAFLTLAIGWIVGSLTVPFTLAYAHVVPFYWSLELGTALVAYAFLWGATTFLK
eukprot:TRINITY_DN26280_c0_g1_i1.p1 TRINITY_DN26280_c0_g1~~TRINITY_DN26280_c0_g1_i1.p1  ORF type:complete len:329 (+),score=51.54 TRINITY_DN26280_c0_g1_i1:141-1127(+)